MCVLSLRTQCISFQQKFTLFKILMKEDNIGDSENYVRIYQMRLCSNHTIFDIISAALTMKRDSSFMLKY